VREGELEDSDTFRGRAVVIRYSGSVVASCTASLAPSIIVYNSSIWPRSSATSATVAASCTMSSKSSTALLIFRFAARSKVTRAGAGCVGDIVTLEITAGGVLVQSDVLDC